MHNQSLSKAFQKQKLAVTAQGTIRPRTSTGLDDVEAWRKVVRSNYSALSRAPRERLRWVTVILSVHVVRLSDDIAARVADTVEGLRKEWRNCAMRSGTIKRGTRWSGVVEIDLVHPDLLGGAAKRDLIGALAGVDPTTLTANQRVIVVHLHAVVDCKGHQSPDAFIKDIRATWAGPRRVHAVSIWTTGTVAEELDRLASYSTKLRLQYSQSWEGKNTRYYMAFEPAWKDWMVRLLNNLRLHNTILSSVSSRSTQCPSHIDENLSQKRVEADEDGTQLITEKAIDEREERKPKIATLRENIIMRYNQFIDSITERRMAALNALNREAKALAHKIEKLRQGLIEGTKPLTPEQLQRLAECDRKRQDRMREIQSTAQRRVNTIKSEIRD